MYDSTRLLHHNTGVDISITPFGNPGVFNGWYDKRADAYKNNVSIMSLYAKAIAALVMSLVAPFGITATTTFSEAVVILVTAALTTAAVYFIPNR